MLEYLRTCDLCGLVSNIPHLLIIAIIMFSGSECTTLSFYEIPLAAIVCKSVSLYIVYTLLAAGRNPCSLHCHSAV